MIRLNRDNLPAPAILTGEKSPGFLETLAAIERFSKPGVSDKKFEFKAYRDETVKKALIKLSGGKCAYCETKEGGSDMDIEHFRPKGQIGAGKTKSKKGYYWLAAKWENLFLSCQHCNQSRRHDFSEGKARVSGKKNLFPLEDETKRAKEYTDNIDNEKPLLLDPVKDEPEKHFCYAAKRSEKEGQSKIDVVIMPADFEGSKSKKADASITIYGLNRANLADRRVEKYNSITSIMDEVNNLTNAVQKLNNQVTKIDNNFKNLDKGSKKDLMDMRNDLSYLITNHQETINSHLKALSKAIDDDQPFAGMVRYFVVPFLQQLRPK